MHFLNMISLIRRNGNTYVSKFFHLSSSLTCHSNSANSNGTCHLEGKNYVTTITTSRQTDKHVPLLSQSFKLTSKNIAISIIISNSSNIRCIYCKRYSCHRSTLHFIASY